MTDASLEQHRRRLLSLYQTALRRVNGERAVEHYLNANPLQGEWAVIAIGKAAPAMAMGAQRHLGGRLHSGLVITKYGHADPRLYTGNWRQLESGHPLPDENSLAAGEALLEYLAELPVDTPLLFLLSGGASALAEALPEGAGLADLKRLNDWLLASGLGIGEMNAIRKRLSRSKGGRLVRNLRGRRCLQLLISDVPGDDVATIGSGPLQPAPEKPLPDSLPDWINQLLGATEPAPD
ncbi:MAG: glycerate-2-kinase family protein, partial [Pseudomonadota bacterium]